MRIETALGPIRTSQALGDHLVPKTPKSILLLGMIKWVAETTRSYAQLAQCDPNIYVGLLLMILSRSSITYRKHLPNSPHRTRCHPR